jgi:uncharacterized protein (TIGR03435 family)
LSKTFSALGLFLFCLLPARAQSFDVASVRPHPQEDDRFGVKMPAEGQFRATGATAKVLLMLAYDVQETQIVGAPDWVDSVKWDIEAKSESDKHTVEETRRMLQSMLQERFSLGMHRETQQRSAYVLTVAKGGSKFKAATEGATNIRVAAGSIRLERGGIAQMTQVLSTALGRPVIDRTGLAGTYDLTLQWDDAPRDQPAAPGRDYGSVFTAMQEQLGLQLESQQVPVDVVVIERIERPSQN